MRGCIAPEEVVVDLRKMNRLFVRYAEVCNAISELKIRLASLGPWQEVERAGCREALHWAEDYRAYIFERLDKKFIRSIERYNKTCN